MSRQYPENSGQGGYALMEHMGGLLFYLTMGAAAAIILTVMFSDSKVSETQQAVTTIRLKTKQVFTGGSSYSGLDNDFAIKAGIVPAKMVRGDDIRSAWGSDVEIAASSSAATFSITLNGIPEKACVGLSAYQVETWESIEVNSTPVARDDNITVAAASCSGNDNTLVYSSR